MAPLKTAPKVRPNLVISVGLWKLTALSHWTLETSIPRFFLPTVVSVKINFKRALSFWGSRNTSFLS
jgi:hypothetical protein